jgi:hypothetical protein
MHHPERHTNRKRIVGGEGKSEHHHPRRLVPLQKILIGRHFAELEVTGKKLADEQKLELFNQSLSKLTELTVEMIAESVFYVKTPDDFVEDREFIQEFIQNADASLIQKIQDLINENKKTIGILPLTVHATEEQILAGAPESYELPITMDNSNFFVRGS